MGTFEAYRKYARDCFAMAQTASDSRMKTFLFSMAQILGAPCATGGKEYHARSDPRERSSKEAAGRRRLMNSRPRSVQSGQH
jgi:hypothetical protein